VRKFTNRKKRNINVFFGYSSLSHCIKSYSISEILNLPCTYRCPSIFQIFFSIFKSFSLYIYVNIISLRRNVQRSNGRSISLPLDDGGWVSVSRNAGNRHVMPLLQL